MAILALAASLTGGCYYTQAVRGHFELMGQREPFSEVIADPGTSAELRRRLELVSEARDFSVEALALPDNESYRSYADLGRDHVVWNVFATPEFSLEPRQWCYPVVGCVAYRGYYDERDARRLAKRLEEDGYDVHVAGVAAYSTLGRFDDPVLNTMLRWDDVQLVATLFHELAHQVIYIRDDTKFNESFASAVEEFGIESFLESRGAEEGIGRYRERKQLRRQIVALVAEARGDLAQIYSETIDDDEKRLLKEHRLEILSGAMAAEFAASGRDPARWLQAPLNNAHLLSTSLYQGYVPAFRELFKQCAEDFVCFYEQAGRIAELDADDRAAYLERLATRSASTAGPTAARLSLNLSLRPVNRQWKIISAASTRRT